MNSGAGDKTKETLKVLRRSHRSGHGSMLVNCAAREVNSGILESLSTALFFPCPTKQIEMFQFGEHVADMMRNEIQPFENQQS